MSYLEAAVIGHEHLELELPSQAVVVGRNRGDGITISTNPEVRLEPFHTPVGVISPQAHEALRHLNPEALPDGEKIDVTQLDIVELTQVVTAGRAALGVLGDIESSTVLAKRAPREKVRKYRGKKLPFKVFQGTVSAQSIEIQEYLDGIHGQIKGVQAQISLPLQTAERRLTYLMKKEDCEYLASSNGLVRKAASVAIAGAAALGVASPSTVYANDNISSVNSLPQDSGHVRYVTNPQTASGTERVINVQALRQLLNISSVPEHRVFQQAQPQPEPTPTEAIPNNMNANVRRGPGTTNPSWGTPSELNLPDRITVYGQVPEGNLFWYYFELPGGRGAWMRSDILQLIPGSDGPVELADFREIYDIAAATAYVDQRGNPIEGFSAADVIPLHVFNQFREVALSNNYPPGTFAPGALQVFDRQENYLVFKQTVSADENPAGSVFVVEITDEGHFGNAEFFPSEGETIDILQRLGYPAEVDFRPTNVPGVLSVNRSGVELDTRKVLKGDTYEDAFSYDPPSEEVVSEDDIEPREIVFNGVRWLFDNDSPYSRDILAPTIQAGFWEQQRRYVLEGTEVPFGRIGEVNVNGASYVVFSGIVSGCQEYRYGSSIHSIACGMVVPSGQDTLHIIPIYSWGNNRDYSSIGITATDSGLLRLLGSNDPMPISELGLFEPVTPDFEADNLKALRPGEPVIFALMAYNSSTRQLLEAIGDGTVRAIDPVDGYPEGYLGIHVPPLVIIRQ